jgi:hypothetical protein
LPKGRFGPIFVSLGKELALPTVIKTVAVLLMVGAAIPARAESLCSISAKATVESMQKEDAKTGIVADAPTVATLTTAWDNGKQAGCSASFVPAPDFCDAIVKAAQSPELNSPLRGPELPVERRIVGLALMECVKSGGRGFAPLGRAWEVSLWDDHTGITVRWWATDTPNFGGQFQAPISK